MEQTPGQDDCFTQDHYCIKNLDDEIRADRLCQKLLKNYLQYLVNDLKMEALDAGTYARAADYFLRDYLIDQCRENIFSINSEHITAFAGNWYIVSTLEPNWVELESLLEGIQSFYSFCSDKKLIDPSTLDTVSVVCANRSYYQQRIESFYRLQDDEFFNWNEGCPLR